jgi:hypothetical protein
VSERTGIWQLRHVSKEYLMSTQKWWIPASAALLAALAWTSPTHALSMRECSAKYEAAKSAGTLGGMTWNAFRSAQCGSSAAATTAPQPPATTGRSGRNSYGYISGANAVFPTGISPKYANESAGRARMHTCLDQYRTNKVSGGNGGLEWIQKGGGYYSACNKRLGGR